jgi:GNAT superfamily N-acetyltransferase
MRPEAEMTLLYDGLRESPALAAALGREISARYGPRDEHLFSFILRDRAGTMIGGINGAAHWSWFYIRHLWVAPERRRQGLARTLLKAAETKAREAGAAGLYIDAFDPAVAALYERCGFVRAGVIEGFPPGAARYFLFRKL